MQQLPQVISIFLDLSIAPAVSGKDSIEAIGPAWQSEMCQTRRILASLRYGNDEMHLSRCNGIEPIPPHFSTTAVLHTLHPALSIAWLTLKRSPLHKHQAAFFPPGWQPLSDSILNLHLFALMMKSTKGREKRKSYHSEKNSAQPRRLRGTYSNQCAQTERLISATEKFKPVYTNLCSSQFQYCIYKCHLKCP